MQNKLDKDYLVSEYWRYFNKLGRHPSKKEMTNKNGVPSASSYAKYWGSWNNFLKFLGVLGQNGWYVCDEQVVIDKYETCSQEDIINSLMFTKSWDTIKRKASDLGLRRNMSAIKKEYSEKYLLEKLADLAERIGRVPRYIDMESYSDMPSPKTYIQRFGGWNKALELLGFKPNTNFTHCKEDLIKEAIEFYQQFNRSPFYNDLSYSRTVYKFYWNTWTEFLKECKLPLNKRENSLSSKEDGINYLINLSKELNKVPSSLDVENDGIPRDWFARNFGSYRLALFEANLITENEIEEDYEEYAKTSIEYLNELARLLNRVPTVEEYHMFLSKKETKNHLTRENLSNRMEMKFTEICREFLPKDIIESELNTFYVDKNNDRCFSIPELKISNLLIDNNIKFKKETLYKDVIDVPDRIRFDWEIVNDEESIYVEYFGLFHDTPSENKMINDYYNGTKRKIKLCKDNNVKLIELYRDDLKDNFKGLIDKFKSHKIDIKIVEDKFHLNQENIIQKCL